MTVFWTFLGTLAVGVRFNLPKKALAVSSTIAASSYFVVLTLRELGATNAESCFAGAFLVAMCSEILARVMKVPSPVLSIPGVIPLVPGSVAYRAVIHLVQGDELLGVEIGIQASLSAVAVASGLLLASSLSRKLLKPVYSGRSESTGTQEQARE